MAIATVIEGRRDWRALCKLVSGEQDSEKLHALLAELVQKLDEGNEPKAGTLPGRCSIPGSIPARS